MELIKISEWFRDNRLSLHPKKTNVMVFRLKGGKNYADNVINLTLNGIKLNQCGADFADKSVKFLGIMLDDNLDWSEHIRYVANKLRKIIYSLKQVKKIFPLGLRLQLFKSLFVPHAEYGIEIFGSSKCINKLVKLHKWGIRTALNSKFNAHTEPLYKQYNILKLINLYEVKCMTLIRAKIDNETPEKIQSMFLFHNEKNRKKYVVEQLFPTNKKVDSLPSFTIPRIWNKNRPQNLEKNKVCFKNKLKQTLLDKYTNNCNIRDCYICSA